MGLFDDLAIVVNPLAHADFWTFGVDPRVDELEVRRGASIHKLHRVHVEFDVAIVPVGVVADLARGALQQPRGLDVGRRADGCRRV